MSSLSPYDGKLLVIVTGASRGLGREIAKLVACKENGLFRNVNTGSQMLLMSSNESQLQQTKMMVEEVSEDFHVVSRRVDFSDAQRSREAIDQTFTSCAKDFNHVILFSNAATLGDPSKLLPDYTSLEEIQSIFNINVISPSYLISRFCKIFEMTKRVVVNITSIAGLGPYKSLCFYSTTKACVQMLIKNLVNDCPDVRAVSYHPGILDTKMGQELMNQTCNEDIKAVFTELFTQGTILSPLDSAKKLITLLKKDEFTNGDYVAISDV